MSRLTYLVGETWYVDGDIYKAIEKLAMYENEEENHKEAANAEN